MVGLPVSLNIRVRFTRLSLEVWQFFHWDALTFVAELGLLILNQRTLGMAMR